MNENVRIVAAAVASVMVGVYGLAYNGLMISIVTGCNFGSFGQQNLPVLTQFALNFDAWWFLLVAALTGLAVWWAGKGNALGLQVTLSATWLISLAWVLYIHIVWLLPMVPLCSPVGFP